MRRVLIVTAREYRRMTSLPAFWIISLIVPLFVLAVPVAQTLLGKSQTVGYVLVDKSGRYAPQINRRIELDYQRQVLVQLLVYAQQWRASSTAVPDVAAAPEAGSSSSDTVVQNFVAAGGAPTVLRLLQPRLLRGAPAFQPPPRPLVEIPLPEGVATDSADRFGTSIGPDFRAMSKTSAGKAGLGVAVYIPDNVDSGGQARVWTNGPAGAALVQDLRSELTQGLRLNALRAAAVDPLSVAQIESMSAPVSISAPEAPTPGGEAIIHSTLPLVLAGLLLVSMMNTGAMMLQGLVEERSNKLLEAVLACVSPRELMVGKLLGISALGLSIIGIWVGATIGIARAEPSSPLGVLVPALAALGQTPWIVVAMIFYFLAGYLTLGMIFLAVGVLSDSMQEAQAYLMPLILVIVAPAVGLGSVIFRDPNGLLPRIISWIPLYTPLAMLARLQSGVSIFEILGTAAALLSFGALEVLWLGHLFENHLISTGGGFRLTSQTRRTLLRGTVPVVVVAIVAVVVVIRHSRAAAPGTDQTGALRTHGESVFKTACASCHDPAVGGTLSREQMASLTPQEVVETLTSGGMKPMAARLSDADIESVATYLTNRQPGPPPAAIADPPPCSKPATFGMTGGGWNGWSIDPRNWRLQPDPGLTAADIPRLKVKWALSYVGGKYGQPTLVGGRLFLTSRAGVVYSLEAKTGCMYWRFAESVPSRTTVSVGPLPGVAPSGYAAYFGDFSANVYAVDASSGALLWKTQVDPHPRAMLTGSPVLFRGRLYVPVSSNEEGVASSGEYACCTFRGSVDALDAGTGKVVWKTFGIDREPGPTNKNSAGTQMYGPAGAGVWSAPTIDDRHSRLFFATGNSYTDVAEGGSDAVIAVDLASGRTLWRRQMTQSDNALAGCAPGRKLVNCPATLGHDHDFGASPILMTLRNGKDIVLAGQKSGEVFGIDPNTGEILWRTQVGVGGFLGGDEWGMASDGTRLYVANADIAAQSGRPGLFALDLETGKDLWYAPSPRVGCGWASGAPCFNAQSAAPSAIPGVVFSGTTDGHERAYGSADGRILWDFDTARDTYRTINGIGDQAGGSIDVTSGVLADGMLYLISGYRGPLGGGSQNVLLAFSIDGR